MHSARRLFSLLWASMLALLAFGAPSLGQDLPRHERPAPTEPEPEQGGEKLDPVAVPDTDVGRALEWVMGVINGVEPGDVASHFTPRYLERFSVAEITETLTMMREKSFRQARVDLIRVEEEDVNELALSGIIHGHETRVFLTVFISLDEASKKIAGLVFSPAGFAPVGDGAEGPDRIQAEVGGSVLFGAYEIVPTRVSTSPAPDATIGRVTDEGTNPANAQAWRLDPVYEFGRGGNNGGIGNIAGVMRLWITDAIAEGLASKSITWDQPIEIRDEFKCIPGGATSDLPAGEKLTLGEMAQRMNTQADTTAMEHLFQLLTREKVEAAAIRSAPPRQPPALPLLSVRQMFALKLSNREVLVTDYQTEPLDQRRAMLAPGGEIALLAPDWTELEAWSEPRLIESVGFFASPEAISNTLALIKAAGASPEGHMLLDQLAGGVGLELDQDRWPASYGASGAEPGVAAAALLVRRSDDRWFAIVAIWNNPEKTLEGDRLDNLMRHGIKLCDQVGREEAEPASGGGEVAR